MATFDPNTWYGVSEGHVDNVSSSRLGGGLQGKGDTLNVFPRNNQDWQLQPVDGIAGRYLLRTNTQGPEMQLSSCYKASEIHPAKTGVCLRPTTSDDAQKWDITNWGDGTFRITNVANGTGFWVDVHPFAALFMNNETESSSVSQPAQHWIFTSDKPVNDGAYSTIYSAPSTATGMVIASNTGTSSGSQSTTTTTGTGTASGAGLSTASNSPQNGSGSSGLSSGAAAGIGVAATLAVLGLVAFTWFCFWRRRRRNPPHSDALPAETATQQSEYKPDSWNHRWSQSPPPAPVYSQQVYHEVPGPVWQSELPGSPPADGYYPTRSPSPPQLTQSTVSPILAHQPPTPPPSHTATQHANG